MAGCIHEDIRVRDYAWLSSAYHGWLVSVERLPMPFFSDSAHVKHSYYHWRCAVQRRVLFFKLREVIVVRARDTYDLYEWVGRRVYIESWWYAEDFHPLGIFRKDSPYRVVDYSGCLNESFS